MSSRISMDGPLEPPNEPVMPDPEVVYKRSDYDKDLADYTADPDGTHTHHLTIRDADDGYDEDFTFPGMFGGDEDEDQLLWGSEVLGEVISEQVDRVRFRDGRVYVDKRYTWDVTDNRMTRRLNWEKY